MQLLASYQGEQGAGWTLLLQTDATDSQLYVAVSRADLAAGLFTKAEAIIEHD